VISSVDRHFLYIQCPDITGGNPYVKIEDEWDLDEYRIGMVVEFQYAGRREVAAGSLNVLACDSTHFTGRVKYISASREYGFVECPALSRIFPKDIFVGEQNLMNVLLHDIVNFTLGLTTRGDPEAKLIGVLAQQNQSARAMNRRILTPPLPQQIQLTKNSLLLLPQFLSSGHASLLYETILKECPLIARLGHSHMGARNPNGELVLAICSQIGALLNMDVGNIVVSYYPTGGSFRPYHQDKFRSNEEVAAIVSLGCARKLVFKHIHLQAEEIIPQGHGSLTVFDKALNAHWLHGLEPDASARGGRISLTFWGAIR
jgi:hypothetical protein